MNELKPFVLKSSVDLSKVRGGPGQIAVEIGRGLSKDRTYFIHRYGVDPMETEDENAEEEN